MRAEGSSTAVVTSRWPKLPGLACGRQRGLRHGADLIIRKVDPKHVLEPTFFATQQSCFENSRRGFDLGVEGSVGYLAFFGREWFGYLFNIQGCNLYRQQTEAHLECRKFDDGNEKF